MDGCFRDMVNMLVRICLLSLVSTALLSATAQADELKDGRRMTFMQHYDPQFLKGLEKHGFPTDHGYRLGNTGFMVSPFGPRWINSPKLAKAKAEQGTAADTDEPRR